MIEIWICDVTTLEDARISELLLSLPMDMQREVMRYKFAQDQKFKLLGRLMVEQYHKSNNIPFNFNNWKVSSNKKPFISNGKSFNISHSGDFVVAAFSDAEIGVDIEIEKEMEVDSLVSYFHPVEVKQFESSENKLSEFYKIWTRKEAFLKAKGIGLIHGLDKNNCLFNPILEDQKWFVKSLEVVNNYHLAICTLEEEKTVKWSNFDGSEFL